MSWDQVAALGGPSEEQSAEDPDQHVQPLVGADQLTQCEDLEEDPGQHLLHVQPLVGAAQLTRLEELGIAEQYPGLIILLLI